MNVHYITNPISAERNLLRLLWEYMSIYFHHHRSEGERLTGSFQQSDLGAADTLRMFSAEKVECLQAFAGMFLSSSAEPYIKKVDQRHCVE